MNTLHVFDLDGTLFETFAANKAAYEMAGLPEYKQEYYWQTAAAWDCPPDIHERKGELMPNYANLINSAWAMPFFEIAERAGVALVLTGASSNSVRLMEKIHGRAFPTTFGISLSELEKRQTIFNLVRSGWNVVYYDDNYEMGKRIVKDQSIDFAVEGIVGHIRVTLIHPGTFIDVRQVDASNARGKLI